MFIFVRFEFAAALQYGYRVDWGTGSPGQPQRRDDAQERPAACRLAYRQQVIELQVVEQVQAHGIDRQHMDGKGDAVDKTGRGIAVAVAAQCRRSTPL